MNARKYFRSFLGKHICQSAGTRELPSPVFILCPPRSGSTLLFELISKHTRAWHHREEANEPWWVGLNIQSLTFISDEVPSEGWEPGVGDRLAREMYRCSVLHALRRKPAQIRPAHIMGTRPIPYLDKTIANCFRWQAILKWLPDAKFIVLWRDPRAVISSMAQGWGYSGFRHPLASAACATSWYYPAPPGWRAHVEEDSAFSTCAWIWREHVRSVQTLRVTHPQSVRVERYENLIQAPQNFLEQIVAFTGWQKERHPPVQLHESRTTLSPPQRDKWKKDRNELAGIWPDCVDIAEEIGYADAP